MRLFPRFVLHSAGSRIRCRVKHLATTAVVLVLSLINVRAAEPKTAFKVSLDKRYQTMDGFGTCLTFWDETAYLRPEWQKMYWDDMGCSILRMELVPFVLTPNKDGKLAETPIEMGENIDENIAKFDWKPVNMFGQVAIAAKKYAHEGDTRLIGSLWSPPPWMKDRGEVISPANHNTVGGALKQTPENLVQFGRYVAAYLKGFQQHFGVPIEAISIQNELELVTSYNSCKYEPDEYVNALKAVYEEIQKQQLSTRLIGPECCGIGNAGSVWNLWKQMTYIDAVKQDPEANKALAIYAVHGYAADAVNSVAPYAPSWLFYLDGKGPVEPNPDKSWAGTRGDGKTYWQTETSGEKNTWLATNALGQIGAFAVAHSISNALVFGQNSAYVYWQMGDGHSRDGGGGLINFLDTKLPKYCAAKHFFRYIRPGAVRVDTGSDQQDGVQVSAFVHDKNHTMTVVALNPEATPVPITVQVPPGYVRTAFQAFRSSEDERFEAQPDWHADAGGILSATLPSHGIVTLYGVSAP